MSYCTKCGSEIQRNARYCPKCGAPVKIETVSPQPTYTPTTTSSSLVDRMIRAARLDVSLYEEVERDERATTQALIVVVLSSISSGIGTALSKALTGHELGGIGIGLFGGLFSALIVWLVWSFITYFVGTKIFGGTASYGELLRTIGFADAPGVLLVFSFIPILGGVISFAVWVWGLMAMVVAVQQALDFSTGKAVLTCIVGWIAALILLAIIGILLAIPLIFLG
ncbi:MAG: YIP1 family protein [Candidatus Bathyarchaeota archaeon]|nr:MAG: YIP1 family protein [Candidatus Bathyarchaeota archaeon]